MPCDTILRDGCDLTASHWVNDAERMVSLVGNQEQPAPGFATRLRGIQDGPSASGDDHKW